MSTNLEKNKEIVLNSSYTSFHGFFSPTTILIFIWLAAGTAALFISLLWLPAIYIDGQYIPAGADSFYHARRILDLVTHNTYFQFDPKIHAPEGGLLTWPWAYDYLIGQLVLAIQTIFGISDPMMVIAYIPSAWVYINAAILLGITSLLKLSMPLRLVAVLCFAFLPLTQSLHGAGRIDHHFMEHTMVLLTLFAGINWFQKSASTKSSILFGLVLGFAPGINNGLFVLQIPILATLFILWLKNRLPDQRGAATFGFTLIISTLLLLLPSRAFHEGINSYYYLSWFHLYTSCSSAFFIFYITSFAFSKKSFFYLCTGCVLLIAAITPQVISGSDFLFAKIQTYKDIPETYSLFKQITLSGLTSVINSYTLLPLSAPVVLGVYLFQIRKPLSEPLLYLASMCIFGFFMLTLQLRLNYFGSYALYLPLLLIFNELICKTKINRKYAWVGLSTLIVLCYVPALNHLTRPIPPANSFDYAVTRNIYPAMNKICNKNPGVILADYSDGNYIRFHSDCSVIANNMVITPQDVEKVMLTKKLMETPASKLITKFPWIDYVFVKRNDNIMVNKPISVILRKNKGLRDELLLRGDKFPPGYVLVKQLLLQQRNGKLIPLARLFKINHSNN